MIPNELKTISNQISQVGGKVFLVGGFVRDKVLGIDNTDFDCEVFGLDKESLIKTLQPFGKVSIVGVSFGVIILTLSDGTKLDFSLLRRESKKGRGHKAFKIEIDQSITLKEAASRRDFTFNAMSMDIETGEIVDFFGGQENLKTKEIKATSPAFKDDPLRVLRGFQFAARFEMFLADKDTIQMCKEVKVEFDTLAKERLWIEWEKWAFKGKKPSLGLDFLKVSTWLDCFPEIVNLDGLEQNPKWHPEGDVLQHTKLVVDKCAEIATENDLTKDQRLVLVFASLCHDFGKVVTTETVDGKITSKGHDKASTPFVKSFLESIDAPKWLMEQVIPLCENHMFRAQPTHRNIRRLARRLSPSNIQMLVWLMEADKAHKPHPTDDADEILRIAQELNCEAKEIPDILMGRHLIELGLSPSKHFGIILKEAKEAQLDGAIIDLDSAMKWARERIVK